MNSHIDTYVYNIMFQNVQDDERMIMINNKSDYMYEERKKFRKLEQELEETYNE